MRHQNYFANAANNKQYAKNWIDMMLSKYNDKINRSIALTTYYNENNMFVSPFMRVRGLEIDIKETDSVSAVFEETYYAQSWGGSEKVCVLNFASYKNPGGMFIEGSNAQEECLCRESTLYPVLKSFEDNYYKNNKNEKNRGLYLNRALYSPYIVFHRYGTNCTADVLTCAAPNFTSAKKYCNVTKEENIATLESRCEFVLDIMNANDVKVPILGAFGCGVFGQDAHTVANIFKTILESKKHHSFNKVVFAVIPGPNAEAFKEVFNGIVGNREV